MSDCVLWDGYIDKRTGYGQTKRHGRTCLAHRVAWEDEHGPIPEEMCVCHHCDVRACVNVDHMFLGTQADNIADRDRKGRTAMRTRNGKAKLTEEQYDELERRASAGERQSTLAQEFGVTRQSISQYLQRRHAVTHSTGRGG